MKKIASLLLIIVAFASCTEDITKNNPSFQGLKDDVLWRAKGSQATIGTNGALTITGLTEYETLTLKTSSANPGTYALGVNTANQASYVYSKDDNELIYETGTASGDGEVKITEYDPILKKISGTFRFNAENVNDNPLGGPTLNYQQGVFYKVPVVPAL